jgi:hypothetical protein
MDMTLRDHGLVDLVQESQEFLCVMAAHAIADDLARLYIQCR